MCGVILGLITPFGAVGALESGKKGPDPTANPRLSDDILQGAEKDGKSNSFEQMRRNSKNQLPYSYAYHHILSTLALS